jgi:hypothetical protein
VGLKNRQQTGNRPVTLTLKLAWSWHFGTGAFVGEYHGKQTFLCGFAAWRLCVIKLPQHGRRKAFNAKARRLKGAKEEHIHFRCG